MMKDNDVEQIRSGYERSDRDGSPDGQPSGGYSPKAAVALFLLSVFLLALLSLVVATTNIGALGIGQVGGVAIEGETIVGNNINIYPYPTETSACYSNSSSDEVGSSDEVAAGALKADIGQLRIPSDKQLTIKKDIKTPSIANISTFRIKVTRASLRQNPSYPPSADFPAAAGEVRGSYVERVQAAGIDTGTGSNDGYADITFERSRNITAGDSFNLTVTAVGDYDYTAVDTSPYPLSQGRDQNRYVDDVEAQSGSLSNTGTGDDGGYFPYTRVSNAPDNASTGVSESVSVDAVASDADFTDASPKGTPSGRNTNSYIDDVTVDTISNTGTGNNGGYADFTGQSTSRLNRDNTVTIDVSGSKIQPTFEPVSDGDGDLTVAPDPKNNYGSQTNFNACNTGSFTDDDCASIVDVKLSGIDRVSGDDNGYFPDGGDMDLIGSTTTPVYRGGTVDLTSEFIAESDGDTSVSIAKAWIDWNQNGDMETSEEYFLGSAATDNGDGGSCDQQQGDPDCESDRVTVPIRVPDDAELGSTVLRVVNAMSFNDNEAPDSGYPADVTASFGTIDHLEKEDYVVNVTQQSQVDAFVDYNQDGVLNPTEERVEVGRTVDKTGTFSFSKTISPPPDALSGSSLLRIQHRNDPDPPRPNPDDGGYIGETEDYTVQFERETNSAVHAFVDWNQNGEFDLNVQEEEDFDFGLLGGWTTQDDSGAATDISNSGSYSVNVSAGTKDNQLISPSIDTRLAGGVKLEFWVARGSDAVSNLPEGGENIIVEYKDDTGTWQKLREVRAYNLDPEESAVVEQSITDPDAFHSDFQVRFKGDGGGTDGFDYWHIDDPEISTSEEVQRIGTSTLDDGEFSALGSLDVPPDAAAGSTLLRVVHQQDGYVADYPATAEPPGRKTFEGEAEDYSLHVEPDTSFVRAWIDWNRDQDFFDIDEGPIDLGQEAGPGNTDGFTVSRSVTAPDPLPSTGAAAFRVKHEQKQRESDLTGYSAEGFRGENEDYTLILSDTAGDVSDTGNVTLGDSSLVVSRLTADNIDLTTTLIDEDYSDNTFENPRFGPDGELTVSGDQLKLTNATGVLHQAAFSVLALENISVSTEFNPDSPLVKNQDACGPLGSYKP